MRAVAREAHKAMARQSMCAWNPCLICKSVGRPANGETLSAWRTRLRSPNPSVRARNLRAHRDKSREWNVSKGEWNLF